MGYYVTGVYQLFFILRPHCYLQWFGLQDQKCEKSNLWVFKIILPGLYLVFWWYFKYFSTDFQNLNACQHLHLNAYLLALEWGHLVKKCGLQSLSKLPEIWKIFTIFKTKIKNSNNLVVSTWPNQYPMMFLGAMQ